MSLSFSEVIMTGHRITAGLSPNDTQGFAELFVISDPEFIPALFAGTHKRLAAGCFGGARNLLSHEHSHFVRVNGQTAGMVLAYGWAEKKKQDGKTFLLTLKYMRTRFFMRMRALKWSDDVLGKMGEETYYVSNLALYPEFRNKGLGTGLLHHVEELAKKAGAKKLDVDVETANENAIRFYKRFGMSIIGEPKLITIDGTEYSHIRLTKALPRVS